jgi:hypothetical protein
MLALFTVPFFLFFAAWISLRSALPYGNIPDSQMKGEMLSLPKQLTFLHLELQRLNQN